VRELARLFDIYCLSWVRERERLAERSGGACQVRLLRPSLLRSVYTTIFASAKNS